MEFEEWIEGPVNAKTHCDICGERITDGGTQVVDLYVCDNCYEDMQHDVDDIDLDD